MEKEFVTYSQALALKELGFDEPCIAFYDKLKFSNNISLCFISQRVNNNILNNVKNTNEILISAPLYQQAFRWFREKHNLYSEINLDSYKEPYSLKVIIKHLDNTNTFVDKEYYPYSNGIGDIDNKKHEEAESACLDKLIEIVKTM